MRPKDTSFTETHGDLFRSRLEQILDRKWTAPLGLDRLG